MSVSKPVVVHVPANGVIFAESIHGSDFLMPPRTDPYHKLLYVQRGRVDLHWQNGRRHAVRRGAAGAVFVVPAGREHRIADVAPAVILLLCVGTGWVRRTPALAGLWRELLARGELPPALEGAAATEWERRWRRALLEQEGRRAGAAVLRDALALQLLVLLRRQPESPLDDTAEERVRRVTREIDETFSEKWTVDVAAARAGLSRRHFTQCFRQANDTTLVDHLTQLRLLQAERLLTSGLHTVTGAAFSSGFEDLAHFYRLFKRRHGRPPGEWLADRKTAASS